MIGATDLQIFAEGIAAQQQSTEADRRRAISGIYYALFHALTAAGAQHFADGGPALENQVARAYSHGPMRRVCERYIRSAGRPFSPALGSLNTPPPNTMLIAVADAFVQLQEARHMADYDLAVDFSSYDLGLLLDFLRTALNNLADIKRQPATVIFLAALLLDDRWTRRG